MEDVKQLKEYIESILYAVKHESEDKISKSIVAHLLESIVKQLNKIQQKTNAEQI